ncbi:MAG: Hpt domain-containing protein [Campylobacterales bacterium]|nr:Hpt domain-containing protein [Campylobacterales bacterium]
MTLSLYLIVIALLIVTISFVYLVFRKKYPRETISDKHQEPSPLHVQTVITPEEIKIPPIELPSKTYKPFSNDRAVELLGLSQEDADMFIGELIQQFDAELSNLEEAVRAKNYERIETISHSLKGSSTSLGTGGVSDVLIDFNTYVKTGNDSRIIEAHLENLKHYLVDLKRVFG